MGEMMIQNRLPKTRHSLSNARARIEGTSGGVPKTSPSAPFRKKGLKRKKARLRVTTDRGIQEAELVRRKGKLHGVERMKEVKCVCGGGEINLSLSDLKVDLGGGKECRYLGKKKA